jgi:hypothetical protein
MRKLHVDYFKRRESGMLRTDINCMLGHWPFRRLYKNTFEDLKKVHMDNNISSGYVSSIDSIFYNDPFEGDEELHEIIKGSGYQHIQTINPMLPGFSEDIKKGKELFDIRGVKIFPGYHGFDLKDNAVKEMCNIMKQLNVPLFITLRLEDERLNHMTSPRAVKKDEISKFIAENQDLKMILLNASIYEILNLKDCLRDNDNVFFDTCGLKGALFSMDKLVDEFDADRIIFGSLHPLYCFKSTLIMVEKSEISDDDKSKIMGKNIDLLYRY